MKCTKCKDTGWYMYDEHHSTVCEKCCPHDKGWFMVSKYQSGYKEGGDNRCCMRGCGSMYRNLYGR